MHVAIRRSARRGLLLVFVALPALVPVACGNSATTTASPPSSPTAPSDPPITPHPPRSVADEIFVGAGDIGHCDLDGARQTGLLLDRIPGTVFTLGDHAYSSGSDEEFSNCYDPYWGRQKYRTYPVPGNHDYETPGAAPYFAYFSDRAEDEYYKYTLGAWDIYALNSNIDAGEGSPQYAWLESELTTSTAGCALAYWHHPVRSSAKHGGSPELLPLWRLAFSRGVDVVLVGHDHVYERFAPMNGNLAFDPKGMREFVAGTGGGSLYDFKSIQPLSEVRMKTWGVLKLTLRSDGYAWDFMTVRGDDGDSGQEACH